jgi:S-adenosylmethionine:tRNA ribosyltransferase-isomerase
MKRAAHESLCDKEHEKWMATVGGFLNQIKKYMHPKDIPIAAFSYQLPDERIAAFPLEERDASKLLIYKDGNISEDIYRNIAAHIPASSLLVFNNTKVIQARLLFQKPSGGVIEIFCLEPYEDVNEYNVVMNKQGKVKWKCMIGGASKWKGGILNKEEKIRNEKVNMTAALIDKLPDAYVVELSWQPANYTFAEVLSVFGDMPLPPYIKRKAAATDKERYQTIYARHEGSVAAPTAGLHFTENVFASFDKKNISKAYVTLHVGAGTFKPVKAEVLEGHEMHSEWIDVSVETIDDLIKNAGNIIAVGTTSLRTLESLYWMGVKTIQQPSITAAQLPIHQWDVYEMPLAAAKYSSAESLQHLQAWLKENGMNRLFIPTQILIAPGYKYRIAKATITNFHQPQSTLLLLVAAAIGDSWKTVYQYAMEHDFRFLSYGDGCLLFADNMDKK